MSYAPTNIGAFVSAYSGAISGMTTSGWLVDPVQADYALVTQIAGAFAQAFDTVWANATPLNNLEVEAISQIVSESFAHRSPGPQAEPRFVLPSNWAVSAAACAALVLQCDAYFAGQGIDPGTPGGSGGTTVKVTSADTTPNFLASKLQAGSGVTFTVLNPGANERLEVAASGGGGSILSLSNVVYVDKNGTGADPDGSIANPFTTVTAACAAVEGFGNSDNYTLLITPYDYTNEELITLSATLNLNFVGLDTGNQLTRLPNMACPSPLGATFQNCTVGHFSGNPATDGIADTSADGGIGFTFYNANAFAVIGNGSYILSVGLPNVNGATTIGGLVGTFGGINFSGTSFSDSAVDVVASAAVNLTDQSGFNCQSLTCSQFTCDESSFNGNKIGGAGYAQNSSIGGGTWTGLTDTAHPFEFRNMRQLFSLVINCDADAVAMDAPSMACWGATEQFTTLCDTVNRIASLDSEIRFTSGPDAAHTYTMSDANHVIVSEGKLTANRVYKLDTTGGDTKQIFVIDNYGQGNQLAIQQALDNALLYTFVNSASEVVRATFRVLSAGGNTFELFAIEIINR
jgi:hypothetical protein